MNYSKNPTLLNVLPQHMTTWMYLMRMLIDVI